MALSRSSSLSSKPFFVPRAADSAEAEMLYEGFAAFCERRPPDGNQRVYSIDFDKGRGERWTATVGEILRGTKERQRQRGGRQVVVTERLRDGAMVLAIFPGVPYLVVTTAPPIGDASSAWVNPFLAGQPSSVTLFKEPNEEIS